MATSLTPGEAMPSTIIPLNGETIISVSHQRPFYDMSLFKDLDVSSLDTDNSNFM